jgi:hypothetical protein
VATRLTALVLCWLSLPAALRAETGTRGPDRLLEALDSLGIARTELGTRPLGYWTRFPRPEQIPHLLASFPALFSEPLRLYDFGRTMANAAQIYLDPTRPDTPSALHNLIYFLGVDQRVGGFRNYSANLVHAQAGADDLAGALSDLWLRSDALTEYRSFGARPVWSEPPDSQIAQFVAAVPAPYRGPLAVCLRDFAEAEHWWRIAMRNVPERLEARVRSINDLGDTQVDGVRYYPELDDMAARLDEHSLYYAGMKCAAACERLARELSGIAPAKSQGQPPRPARITTPLGVVVVGTTGDDAYDSPAMLILEPGGRDTYRGPSASAQGSTLPLSAVVDVQGDDTYVSDVDFTQGSAVLGFGLVYDAQGDDRYTARNHAQGFGLFGLGVLFDGGGNDIYEMHTSGQGCGYFGIGLHLDGGGRDSCRIWGQGQGHGGVGGGVGVLAALGGDDVYYAEPDPKIAGRADYHSEGKIAENDAQGSGTGRRGDGSDGHSWAGGLGALLDIGGNDRYEAGNWCQAIGYWFGTGILFDSEGDDTYRSVYFSQASGAHFCNAALIDEGGNDRHELWFNKGASMAFGWDYTNALLLDKGGNDVYDGGQSCVALSTGRSHVLLYDAGGDDEYRLDSAAAGFGEASPRDDFFAPDPVAPYMFYSKSSALLLDCGGRDRYVRKLSDGATMADTLAVSGCFWRKPATTDGALHGGGGDFESGRVPDFEWWDRPKP